MHFYSSVDYTRSFLQEKDRHEHSCSIWTCSRKLLTKKIGQMVGHANRQKGKLQKRYQMFIIMDWILKKKSAENTDQVNVWRNPAAAGFDNWTRSCRFYRSVISQMEINVLNWPPSITWAVSPRGQARKLLHAEVPDAKVVRKVGSNPLAPVPLLRELHRGDKFEF